MSPASLPKPSRSAPGRRRSWPLAAVMVAVVPAAGAADAPPALTTAAEIAAAHVAPNARPPRVRLEAVVSYQDATGVTFLVDETGVTDFFSGVTPPPLEPGDVVLVEGVVQNGGFMGAIRASRVKRIRSGPPPEPLELSATQLASGQHVFRRAAMSGIVRATESFGEAGLRLRLAVGGQPATVLLEERPDPATLLVGAVVRAVGIAAGEANDRREVVTPWLRVRSPSDIEILEPAAPPFAGPPVPLAEFSAPRAGGRRVMIRGTAVAGPLGGGLFLRQGDKGIFVEPAAGDHVAAGITAGDVVEAAGFPELGVFSGYLADAVCRVVGRGPPPRPQAVTAARVGNHEADRVAVQGLVVQRIDRGERGELVVDVDGMPVSASGDRDVIARAPLGSVVRLAGPIRVTALESVKYRTKPAGCTLYLAGPADLTVIQAAPWWTPRRIGLAAATVAGAMAIAAGIATGWIVLLRRQVRRQLAVIEGSLRAEAMAEERARIAGDFHDSLEQGLAALKLRLGMAASRTTDPDARGVLEHQRQVLGWLQTETREFLHDLREPVPAQQSLAVTLAAQLDTLQSTTAVPLELTAPPNLPELPAATQHQVVRIVREAVHNAIRHAAADRIVVRVDLLPPPSGDREPTAPADALFVEIRDDGRGFDLTTVAGTRGHYGLRGMEERAKRVGGTLTIEAATGRGTVVRLEVPGPAVDDSGRSRKIGPRSLGLPAGSPA